MKEFKLLKEGKIKNIVFDFGDVIINLDKEATKRELKKLGLTNFDQEMIKTNQLYEKGQINTKDFLDFYQNKIPNATREQLKDAWNSIILDMPKYRVEIIKELSNKFKLYLLSNINPMHLAYIRSQIDDDAYIDFLYIFDMIFYSHLIEMRKPDTEPFEFVLKRNNLKAEETLFIDDTLENCETAKKLGFKVWHLDSENEDIINLKKYI